MRYRWVLVLNGEHSPLLLNILSTNVTLSCLALDFAFADGITYLKMVNRTLRILNTFMPPKL